MWHIPLGVFLCKKGEGIDERICIARDKVFCLGPSPLGKAMGAMVAGNYSRE